MIDLLDKWDTNLFLFFNKLHHPVVDPVMIFLSDNYIAMVILLISLLFWIYKELCSFKKFSIFFAILLIIFGLSDSITSRIFKPGFERLRPCHNPQISSQVYTAHKKCWGGKFGFVSSHSSNSFAVILFFILALRRRYRYIWGLLIYSGLVAYSRIYLGKHYPGDILVGALIGSSLAYMGYRLVTLKYLLKS